MTSPRSLVNLKRFDVSRNRPITLRLSAPPASYFKVALAVVLLARFLWLAWLFLGPGDGFYFCSGDYPTRALIALDWSREPRLLLNSIWLPLSFYLNGLLLKAWPDAVLATTFFHIALSELSVALVFGVAWEIFGSGWAAVAAAVWTAADPVFTRLSISGGASEIELQVFLLLGVWAWLQGRGKERPPSWTAVLAFAAAGGIRHEAWCFMALPSYRLLRAAGAAPRTPRSTAVALARLAMMWIPAGAWIGYHAAQGLFPLVPGTGILVNLRQGILDCDGVRWGYWDRALWLYPRTLWESDPLLCGLAGVGAALAWRAGARSREYVRHGVIGLAGLMLTPLLSATLPSYFEQIVVPLQQWGAPLACAALTAILGRLAWNGPASLALVLALAVPRATAVSSNLAATMAGSADTVLVARTLRRLAPTLHRINHSAVLFEAYSPAVPGDDGHSWADRVVRWAYDDLSIENEIVSAADGRARMRKPRLGLVVTHTRHAASAVAAEMELVAAPGEYRVYAVREGSLIRDARAAFALEPGSL